MTKVLVVCGGDSKERAVSLRSGIAVTEALRAIGYQFEVTDSTAPDEVLCRCDVVFPVLHGVGGEE